ncbi:MAG: hypothetical protein KC776_37810 [Myxococcales bacterium]|nr:hypothetical protein [Myxococcales bacterium]MCB9577225.1 hypothetical protein [Polyangiaceae bacterium]
MRRLPLLVCLSLVGCGGPGLPTGSKRESGQSTLMSQTYAGKNRCASESHDRPFVIEWDATDVSSFEGRAAKDIVFVRYQGCELEVLDGCSDDSIPGKYGSYGPPQWTSGSVEKMNIENEAELYANLPLGAATLGGRVQAGETFAMEYFVSGIETATREKMFRGTIRENPACDSATHFVYAYNLGAFELESTDSSRQSAGASVAGVGAGGERRTRGKAVKKGGELSSCRGSSAKDVHTCRVPIRLTLKPILPGNDAAPPPPSPEQVSKGEAMDQANKHRMAAMQKFQAKDGAGCVAEFDAADRLDPDPTRRSTNPAVGLQTRALCEMLAGQCAVGKRHARLVKEQSGGGLPPEQMDQLVSDLAGQFCTGDAGLDAWDKLVRADRHLREAAAKNDGATCVREAAALDKALKAVPEPDQYRKYQKSSAEHALALAPSCAAKGGRCADARRLAKKYYQSIGNAAGAQEPVFSRSFDAQYPECKGK